MPIVLVISDSMRNASLRQPETSTTATVTHIAADDDRTRYDRMTIALHWLTAALVLTLFLLSQTWGFLDKADRGSLKLTHTTLGTLLVAVIVVRVAWRLFFGSRVVAANAGLMNVATRLGHFLLYILLALQLWLGFLIGWSGKKAALNTFFGAIPSPFAALTFTQEDHLFFEEIHDWFGWSVIVLATGHAFAALFHQYVLKDSLLSRMLPQRAS